MLSRLPVLLCALCLSAPGAFALVVAGESEAASTSAPAANDFGFASVVRVFNTADEFFCSGIYLGHGWVLSAYHVVRDRNNPGGFSFGDVVVGGEIYGVAPGSGVRLAAANGTLADLSLFRLTEIPAGLAGVSISSSTPPALAPVVLAGYGLGRVSTETHWLVDPSTNPDTWTVTAPPGDRQGFFLNNPTLRWGTNFASPLGGLLNDGQGIQPALRTVFDPAIDGEAQAAAGDSGGGLFYQRNGQWELAGILLATSAPFDGQPGNTAVNGNETYAADLSAYRAQILETIPEPGPASLLLLGLALLARRHRAVSAWRSTRPAL